jgi:DNA-binding MurR/RpiR family transcriptional regulator
MYYTILARMQREETIMGNMTLEPSDRLLLMALLRHYPAVEETLTPIPVWKLSQEAGTSTRSATRFFQAMYDAGYMDYRRETLTAIKDGKPIYTSTVSVQLLSSASKHLGEISTINTRRRQAERDKRKKVCRSCGGPLTTRKQALCTECGEVQ